MDHFQYRDGETFCEGVSLSKLADAVGTPAYVYSRTTLKKHLKRIKEAFSAYPTLPCFAVKANSNLAILRDIFSEGFGADLVSGGEYQRSMNAGVVPDQIVFSGVGKKEEEIEMALKGGLLSFNVESAFELATIDRIAKSLAVKAPVCFRVNPNIDAKTNPKIATGLFSTKFGIVEAEVRDLAANLSEFENVELVGVACHIGSQITDIRPMGEAADRMAHLAKDLLNEGHPLKFINMGGGLGIRYKDEPQPNVEEYADLLINHIKPTGLQLIIEPGRVLVGNVGVLLNRVIGVKKTPQKSFAIVDGAMNDVLRPSLYDSYHEILPVNECKEGAQENYDVVGPICETGDYFGKDRKMPQLKAGDLIYLRGCGAYSASMASNYNSRPRSVEVLVDGNAFHVVKPRETLEDLWKNELIDIDGGQG